MSEPQRIAPNKYNVMHGHPLLHEEIAWFELGEHLGVLVEDKIDHDFSWVLFWRHEPGKISAVDCQASVPTFDAALKELHTAMKLCEEED